MSDELEQVVGGEVPRVLTTFRVQDMAGELAISLTGFDPHQDMAALMLAQISLETAGGAKCSNHNVGNISSSDTVAADYFRPPWFTVDDSSSPKLKELHQGMLDGKVPRAFRSYADFFAGVADYVAVANKLGVLEAARSGDATQVATAIKHAYTPDSPVRDTAKSLDSLRRQYLAKGFFSNLPKEPAPATVPAPELRSRFSA